MQLLKKSGMEAVNIKALAKELHCSTQPVYLSFASMGELREELIPIIEHMEKENIYVQVQDIVKTYDNVTASDLYFRIMRCSGIRRWKKILRLVI